jgi:hypothetical protein
MSWNEEQRRAADRRANEFRERFKVPLRKVRLLAAQGEGFLGCDGRAEVERHLDEMEALVSRMTSGKWA